LAEYGATTGFFPVDATSIDYLKQTNRKESAVTKISAYLSAAGLLRNFADSSQDPTFSQVRISACFLRPF
jgi:aconitate hydratase